MKPVVVVDRGSAGDFERRVAALIKKGYALKSSSCGYMDSKFDDAFKYFVAIMELRKMDDYRVYQVLSDGTRATSMKGGGSLAWALSIPGRPGEVISRGYHDEYLWHVASESWKEIVNEG